MGKRLTIKQKRFVKAMAKGNSQADAVILAGYDVKNEKIAASMGSRLVKNELIGKALDEAGLTLNGIASSLTTAIGSGLSVKATNSDAISGLRLASELHGLLKRDTPDNLTQNNIYINELKNLDDDQLNQKIQELTTAVAQLQQ
jgi:hypothetical protein